MKIRGEDGYELWLRYRKVEDKDRLTQYRRAIGRAAVYGKDSTADIIKSRN